MSSSPNESVSDAREGAAPAAAVADEAPATVRKRSQTIAWASGLFLALGVGIPVGFALRDWWVGAVIGIVIGLLTVVGYLKAGAGHAERRAEHFRDMYSREDQEDEDDDGSYN